MPLDPIAYQKVLQIGHHEGMRQMADPDADAIIRELVEREGPAQGEKIFDLLIANIRLPKDQLPQSLLTFIENQQQLPEWADKNKIRLLFDEMSFALSNKMVDYFNKQKNVQFNIPEYLQKDWGLHR